MELTFPRAGYATRGKDMEKPRSFPVILVSRIHGDNATVTDCAGNDRKETKTSTVEDV